MYEQTYPEIFGGYRLHLKSLVLVSREAPPRKKIIAFKFSEILPFFAIFADVSKKSKAVIAIYVYAFEISRFCSFRKQYWLLCYDLKFRRY